MMLSSLSMMEEEPTTTSIIVEKSSILTFNFKTIIEASNVAKDEIFKLNNEKSKMIVALKLKIDEKFDNKTPKINQINRNFLIIYESTVDQAQKIIFWNNEGNLIKFEFIDGQYSAEFTDFVVEFLVENVDEKYIGASSWSVDLILANIFNSNGCNLLMRAIEKGKCLKLIDELLILQFDIDHKSNEQLTAADIAFMGQNKQLDILLKLLQENSQYPSGFDYDDLAADEFSNEIKKFYALSIELHQHIKMNQISEVQSIIKNNSTMRYFYNSSNKSAAAIALENENIHIYDFLVENYCNIGPHENIKSEVFNDRLKRLVGDINSKYSNDYTKKHLAIHHSRAVTSPDNRLFKLHGQAIFDAFNMLDENEVTQQLLKVTATNNNFRTHFDFNRDSVEFICPHDCDSGTKGIFSFNGHQSFIYIGAKKLTSGDAADKSTVFGCLAHQLCYFAMNLTFCNQCKPYAIDDAVNEAKFHEIIDKCLMIIKSHKSKLEMCSEKVAKFKRLISFCKEYVDQKSETNLQSIKIWTEDEITELEMKVKNCNEEISKIQHDVNKIKRLNDEIWKHENSLSEHREVIEMCKNNSESELFINKYKNQIDIIELEIKQYEKSPFNEEIVRWVFDNYDKHLWPAELIAQVPHMIVRYKNDSQRLSELKVVFKDLFDYYKSVAMTTMDETLPMLKKLFDNSIEIKFHELTDVYKAKIYNLKVSFQGFCVKFNEIIEDKNPIIFQYLNADEIREILDDHKILKIGHAQKIDREIYIETDFIDYDDGENFCLKPQNFDEISSVVNKTKMFLLADHAGAGKTTTFKHLSLKLKGKLPHYWVSYIDLQKHLEVYEKNEKNIQVLRVLQEILSITDVFHAQIFAELYGSGSVILLYDGVDEIAPIYKVFFMNFIESVRESTNNQQWIATRPQHIKDLKDKFGGKAYKLMPYDYDKKVKFTESMLKNLNIENVETNSIPGGYGSSVSSYRNANNPLIIKMMTQVFLEEKTLASDANCYSLYEKMIDMKLDIVEDKGKIVRMDCNNLKSYLSFSQIHQIYALKKFGFKDQLGMIDIDEFDLFKKRKNEKSNWTPNRISRYGFLTVDRCNIDVETIDFIYRGFAEFFAAQFVIHDLYKLNEAGQDMNNREVELRVKLLIDIVKSNKNSNIWNFILSYVETHDSRKMKEFFTEIFASEIINENSNDKVKFAKLLNTDG